MATMKRQRAIGRNEQWRVEASPAALASHRDDPAFHQFLTLGRVVNALQYVHGALPRRKRPGPTQERLVLNGFLFMNSVLFEGYKLVQRMKCNFRSYEAWSTGFGALLANPVFQRLFHSSMKAARDAAVFHFGEKDMYLALKSNQLAPALIAVGVGRQVGNVHYQFSDMLAMRIYLGSTVDDEHLREIATQRLAEAADFTVAFLDAGESLIAEAIRTYRFDLLRGSRDSRWRLTSS